MCYCGLPIADLSEQIVAQVVLPRLLRAAEAGSCNTIVMHTPPAYDDHGGVLGEKLVLYVELG